MNFDELVSHAFSRFRKPEVQVPIVDQRELPIRRYELDNNNAIEIGLQPFAPTPDLIYSVPAYYKEWNNGNVETFLTAFLDQEVEDGQVLEANLGLNFFRSFPDEEMVKANTDMVDFMHDIVQVQTMSMDVSNTTLSKQGIEEVKSKYDDPSKVALLQKAADNAGKKIISFVDTTGLRGSNAMDVLGYTGKVRNVSSGFRTIGLDYARKRNAGVFHMMDIDNLPSSKHASQDLLNYYSAHDNMPFHIGGFAYFLPVGSNNKSFIESTSEALYRTKNYNERSVGGSPQISFKLKGNEEIEGITPIGGPFKAGKDVFSHGWEDVDTVTHLRLLHNAVDFSDSRFPDSFFLTQDRTDGYADSIAREHNMGDFIDIAVKVFSESEKTIGRMKSDVNSKKILKELDLAYEKYNRQLADAQRFIRELAKEFVQVIDSGDISFKDGGLDIGAFRTENVMLQHFFIKNQGLTTDFSESDLGWMKYLLGMTEERPETINEKQKAMREWYGEFASEKEMFDSEKLGIEGGQLLDKRTSADRVSLLRVINVRSLAVGEMYRRRYAQEDVLELAKKDPEGLNAILKMAKKDVVNTVGPTGERTKWMDSLV